MIIMFDNCRSGVSVCQHAGSHPYIGCTVMVLSLIQLVMGALRPAPDSPVLCLCICRRVIFNWMHLVTGTAGQVLAVACVFLGVSQQALLLPSPSSLQCWLHGCCGPCWLTCCYRSIPAFSGEKAVEYKERRENILSAQSWRQQPEEQSNVKKTVFVVFLLGNTAFLAAFITTIASV
ncbi:hypothetical protein KUCAC02_017765 [Chaenocephalus aceratus]|uniref:Uncharacterized protein n=1 Tax=Chaenocephalus aceratus TaxID=36190 RepID=A0ACB9W258_CHAAC|nr:hypothetical protein KUCAC02_017765 [Chaenocephalus aceratus]